jgi:hypothetical protein
MGGPNIPKCCFVHQCTIFFIYLYASNTASEVVRSIWIWLITQHLHWNRKVEALVWYIHCHDDSTTDRFYRRWKRYSSLYRVWVVSVNTMASDTQNYGISSRWNILAHKNKYSQWNVFTLYILWQSIFPRDIAPPHSETAAQNKSFWRYNKKGSNNHCPIEDNLI